MLTLAAAALAAVLLFVRTFRGWIGLSLIGLLAAAAVPRQLVKLEDVPDRTDITDIATAGPALSTTSIAILCMLLITASATRRERSPLIPRAIPMILPFVLFCVVAYAFVWPHTPSVRGGIISLTTALLAWVVGRRFQILLRGNTSALRMVAGGLLFLFAIEVAVAFTQLAIGITELAGRGAGTFAHPAWLGKYVLVLMPLLLPLTASDDRRTARLSSIALMLALVGTALTVARANLLVLIAVILAWSLFRSYGAGVKSIIFRRAGVPLAVALLSLPFASLVLERFASDPDGGDRTPLLDAGLRIIALHPLVGTGPNNYVPTARASEAIVFSTGYPVHNTFLLGIAELGIFGLVLFALPVVAAVVTCIGHARDSDKDTSNTARAFLITIGGVAIVGLSGWGFWQDSILQLLFFGAGYAHAKVAPVTVRDTDALTRSYHASRRNRAFSFPNLTGD